MDKYSEIKSFVLKPKNLGVETLEDGTILIGKAPDIAPRAWLNGIFPVLSDEEFGLLTDELNTNIRYMAEKFEQVKNRELTINA